MSFSFILKVIFENRCYNFTSEALEAEKERIAVEAFKNKYTENGPAASGANRRD